MYSTPPRGDIGPRSKYLTWLPSGRSIEPVPAGVFWNAVRVPGDIGEQVLALLSEYTGTVIEDVPAQKLYWLIPARSGKEWDLPSIQVLSNDAWLGVPGSSAEHPCRWRVGIEEAGALTEPDALRSALVTVVGTGGHR